MEGRVDDDLLKVVQKDFSGSPSYKSRLWPKHLSRIKLRKAGWFKVDSKEVIQTWRGKLYHNQYRKRR